jgi:hypothetical protein
MWPRIFYANRLHLSHGHPMISALKELPERTQPIPLASVAQGGVRFWREVGQTAGVGILVVTFCGALLLQNPQWFWADDFQSYQLANYLDIARAWHDGEFPLLSPYSWQSGALAGEYQNGVFSIAIMALVVFVFSIGLSLTSAATFLSVTHLVILATGTFQLGRRRGLPADLRAVGRAGNGAERLDHDLGSQGMVPCAREFCLAALVLVGSRSFAGANGRCGTILTSGNFFIFDHHGWLAVHRAHGGNVVGVVRASLPRRTGSLVSQLARGWRVGDWPGPFRAGVANAARIRGPYPARTEPELHADP